MDQRRHSRDYTRAVAARDDRLRSLNRSSDFTPTLPAKPQANTETADELLHGSEEKRSIRKQRQRIWRQIRIPHPRVALIVGVCLALLVGGGGWLYEKHRADTAPPRSPFNAALLASLKFPAYYPSWLPPGYHIDYTSTQEPTANVVTFTMRGPNGAKLYMSEVPRPTRYNIGGYFNSLGDLKELAAPSGTIAVGRGSDDVTLIGNRLYNNTWVLCNTKAPLTYDQLIKMLKSLTLAY